MCEDNNLNTSNCSCLNELFTTIIKLQKKDKKLCEETGCDRPFLGPVNTSFCYNMTTDLNAYFQINSLKSYKSVIPNSMGGKNETETFVSFDNEKYSNIDK